MRRNGSWVQRGVTVDLRGQVNLLPMRWRAKARNRASGGQFEPGLDKHWFWR